MLFAENAHGVVNRVTGLSSCVANHIAVKGQKRPLIATKAFVEQIYQPCCYRVIQKEKQSKMTPYCYKKKERMSNMENKHIVEQFLKEKMSETNTHCQAKRIYLAFDKWAGENNTEHIDIFTFFNIMEDHYGRKIKKKIVNGIRYYYGVSFR